MLLDSIARNGKTIHEEARREFEESATDSVNIYGPFETDTLPDIKTRKLYRRKGKWMVRCRGYWCELTGVKVQLENPRIVTFDTEARKAYR